MDHNALKNADIFIMTDLTQTPISNPDSMLGVLCVVVGEKPYFVSLFNRIIIYLL